MRILIWSVYGIMNSTRITKLKKAAAFLLCVIMLLPLASCKEGQTTSGEDSKVVSNVTSEAESSRALIPSERAAKVWNNAWTDKAGGFESADTIYGFDFYKNRELSSDDASALGVEDYKYIFFGENNSRIVNISDGYAVTLPDIDFEPDYSLSGYRSRYKTDDYLLTISSENKNPYSKDENGWNIYLTEWLNRFINNNGFLSANSIRRTKKVQETTELIEGYTVITYNLGFIFSKNFEYPYYDIAVVRKNDEYVQFYLFVMKSKTMDVDRFENIVKSFVEFEKNGKSENPKTAYELKIPENWNAETKAYFDKLNNQNTVDWGFFVQSMPEDDSSNFSNARNKLMSNTERLSTAMDYNFVIMPTYTHIGWGDDLHDFPTSLANEFAGGNGFNGKPVLQFTYQFTTWNNTNLEGYTPMFDVLAGKFDDQFRKIARAIKAYGKPVIFRLNNEMNSDWVSYCGIVTLLDPDIFIDTWKRMYDIFVEEGVDNTIWVFHPIEKTTPYSNWGEWLNYFPGIDYVQMFGAGSYEFNNGSRPATFKQLNMDVYNKSYAYFEKYPWIISEFACGAGGEVINNWGSFTPSVLGRNQASQAVWVKDMFNVLNNIEKPENAYAKNIKAMVWFSVNDYATVDGQTKIVNYLSLDSTLTQTLEAFKQGFADSKAKREQ